MIFKMNRYGMRIQWKQRPAETVHFRITRSPTFDDQAIARSIAQALIDHKRRGGNV